MYDIDALSKQFNSFLYLDDLYSISSTLDLAWTINKERLGNSIGEIDILEKLFSLVGYEDDCTGVIIDRDIIPPTVHLSGKVNPVKLRSYVGERLKKLDKDKVSRIKSYGFKIVNTRKEGSSNLIKLDFLCDGIALIAGNRYRVYNESFSASFDLYLKRFKGKLKEGWVTDGGDILSNVGFKNKRLFLCEISETENIKLNERSVNEKNTRGNLSNNDGVSAFITSIGRRSIDSVIDILSTEVKEKLKIPSNKTRERIPPGITSSSRSNGAVSPVQTTAVYTYEHIRKKALPYDYKDFCRKFDLSSDNINSNRERIRKCDQTISNDLLNSRSDISNRNPLAIVETTRYGGELPLGYYIVETKNVVQEIYEEYWLKYGNAEPVGGCLNFRGDEQKYIMPCINTARCTKKATDTITDIKNCVQGLNL